MKEKSLSLEVDNWCHILKVDCFECFCFDIDFNNEAVGSFLFSS